MISKSNSFWISRLLTPVWNGAAPLFASLLLLAISSDAAAQSSSSGGPRVVLITTGGTIASSKAGGMVAGDKLMLAIPGASDVASVSVESVASVGSSRLGFSDWAHIAEAVRRALADKAVVGVVVTHGTDTLEETAFFLDLVVRDKRPVVITGSMRGSDAVSADGPANLAQAIRVAVDPHARDLGVLVVLDNEIHLAAAAAKSDTTRLSAFTSPNGGPAGIVTDEGVRVFVRPYAIHPTFPLTADQIEHLPRVAIVSVQFAEDDAALRAAVNSGAKAVVVAGFGSGKMTLAIEKAAFEIAGRGLPVVLAARVPAGWVNPPDGTKGAPMPMFMRSGRLSPVKARILAMTALAAGTTLTEDLFNAF